MDEATFHGSALTLSWAGGVSSGEPENFTGIVERSTPAEEIVIRKRDWPPRTRTKAMPRRMNSKPRIVLALRGSPARRPRRHQPRWMAISTQPAAQRRIERPMADIISGNIEARPIGPL